MPRVRKSEPYFKFENYIMKFRILLILSAVFAFAGCKNEASEDTLPSGYEYVLYPADNGGKKAEPGALAFIRIGMRNDEELLVSNYDAPMPQIMPVPDANTPRQLSPPEEALMLMSEGDSLTIIVPVDSMPEEQRAQGFENSNFMYYDIKLVEVKLPSELEAAVAEVEAKTNETIGAYEVGTLEGIQTTESGLKYVIHEKGTGVIPDSADYVFVNYYGALLDSTSFDNSFSRGMPLGFYLDMGRVIEGWDEGIGLLPVGSKATFFIPSELGYGEAGSPPAIPGNAELVFYVELESAVKPQ